MPKILDLKNRLSLINIFVILMLSYISINILFLTNNQLIGYPVYMDDYHALSLSFNSISWNTPRPVIYFLGPFFACLGSTGYYLLILFLMILCAALVLYFLQKLFSCCISTEWIILYAGLLFSCPFIIEVSKFLGIVINLCSALFAVISMILLLKAYRENKNIFFIMASLFYTLSIFTKEDFILPNILFIFYLFFFEKPSCNLKSPRIKLFLFFIYTVIAITGLFIFNKYIVHSVFTGNSISPTAPYTVNLTLISILEVTRHYLISNLYLITLIITIFLILIFCIFFKKSEIIIKLVFLLLIILSLIMPYAVLPHHTYYPYIYNWLPWEGSAITLGLSLLTSSWAKITRYFFIGIITVLLILITYSHRNEASIKYEKAAEKNKNMISTLLYYKKQLNQTSYVGIINATDFAYWLIGDGKYFRHNLGLTPHWIVFVEKNADNISPFNPDKLINIVSLDKICDFSSIKYLYFNAEGNGNLHENC